MALLVLVFVYILENLYKDSVATVCLEAVTDGTPVLNMCEDGYVVGRQVVIDTYGSSAYRTNGGSINCSCTATLTGLPEGTSTTVAYESIRSSYNPSLGCGSSLTISAQLAAFGGNYSNVRYLCIILNNRINLVKTNDTFGVIWQSGPSGSTSGYCLLFSAGPGSFLSVKCVDFERETTTDSQLRTTTFQSRGTTTRSRETTTQSRGTTTHSREATSTIMSKMTTHSTEGTTYDTYSGSTVFGQKNFAQQNELQHCYPLSAVVIPLVITSLLITATVVVHLILYRKRLALEKQQESIEAVMTSPNPAHYDSLDLSRVEPPNLYADTSTGQTDVNTAMES